MDHLPKHPYRQPLPGRSAALSVSKGAIVTAWRALLSARLHTHEASKDAARSGTRVDGEHRPSNRGERAAVTTQGYLAHAFGERSLALQTSLEQLEAMGLGPRDEVVIGAVLTLDAKQWRELPPSQRLNRTEAWWEQLQEEGYDDLTLEDTDHHLLARPSRVGNGMIMFDPQTTP